MANIIDFGKRNIGNILAVAAGATLAAKGIIGAMRRNDPDDWDEDEIEELEPADDESDSPEEATDDGEG